MGAVTGTAAELDAVLDTKVQDMIDLAIRKADIGDGIGYLTAEDVRAHLQEQALLAARRFDASKGAALATFLYRRLNGEAIELVRAHGTKTRAGNQRKRPVSLDRDVASWAGSAEGNNMPLLTLDHEALAEEDGGLVGAERDADIVLEVSRLPSRLRLVLYLVFYEELEIGAAARRLGISAECCRGLRDAALTKLRRCLVNGS